MKKLWHKIFNFFALFWNILRFFAKNEKCKDLPTICNKEKLWYGLMLLLLKKKLSSFYIFPTHQQEFFLEKNLLGGKVMLWYFFCKKIRANGHFSNTITYHVVSLLPWVPFFRWFILKANIFCDKKCRKFFFFFGILITYTCWNFPLTQQFDVIVLIIFSKK